MNDFTIVIYCFMDYLMLKIDDKSLDQRRKLTNFQVIKTVILSSKYFYGNRVSACAHVESHYEFNIPDKSNFNRSLTDL